jgi:hypothetical protein
MGKPVPPAVLSPVSAKPFKLSPDSRRNIAATLELPDLPSLMGQAIEWAIAVYKMQSSLPFVTVGENVAAINEALRAADVFEKTLRPFTDTRRSRVGSKTVHALNPSAGEALASIGKFRAEAQARKEELRQYKRFGAEHGALGALGGYIRFLHDIVRGNSEAGPKQKLLRTFALSVFEAAGIPCGDYYDHPSRMDKLFTPKMPDGPQTQLFTVRLRQEIEPNQS